MSMRRMSFIPVLVLAAAIAIPAAADLDLAEPILPDIFTEPSAEPAPALQLGVEPEARAACLPGSVAYLWTGSCCSFDRQLREKNVCTGGVWVPTGELRCTFHSCNFSE